MTIKEAAERMNVPYKSVWRDIGTISRVIPITKDEEGKVYMMQPIQR